MLHPHLIIFFIKVLVWLTKSQNDIKIESILSDKVKVAKKVKLMKDFYEVWVYIRLDKLKSYGVFMLYM